ncbi:TIGR00282 family metallophosphoesterase [Candidatus Saganbacteria bacterium]|nr:TIGR00282 family metallophosphoesterase [Candidatus Saganbacteria bacterium]
MSPNESRRDVGILFIGDIIGALGRRATRRLLPQLKKKYAPDLIIANAENSAHGYGITEKIYRELLEMGVNALTMGNHVWDKKELARDIENYTMLARPANYPPGTPGNEYIIVEAAGVKVGILNLLGRTFMQCLDCPFQAAERLLPEIKKETPIVIADMHAEATSEKCAMGFFLDGKATAVIGTHTHVMTADERILPKGTAYISDAGMVGARDSIIGMDREQILKRFLTQMPEKFEPTEAGQAVFNAVLIKVDPQTGRAKEIKKIIELVETGETA